MKHFLPFLLFLFSMGTCTSLQAYPIFPRTLSDVYKAADHVVYGKVVGFIEVKEDSDPTKPPPPPQMYNSMVQLLVREEIKGEVKETEICIAHYRGMMCPEPFDFTEGQEVLLFLNKDGKENFYWTYAWSYGARELKAEEYLLYKKKLVDLQTILDNSDKAIQEQQYVDWMVECIKEPLTRWDGTFDLLNEKLEDTPERKLVANPYPLSSEQNKELRPLVFSKKELDDIDIRLLNHLRGKEDKEILDLMYKKMKTTPLDKGSYTFFTMGTKMIAELSHRKELITLSLEIEDLGLSKEGERKIKEFQKIM
ncbi:hypothetical protein [Myroides fluvii]|uniref:hypothetical protein n=1 Tax=Myroides fluvii TaxID=2572594 RepID=UPI00131B5017|nr:hypothetical protein [Myroides fluvii]